MRAEVFGISGLGTIFFAGGVKNLIGKINTRFPMLSAKHFYHTQSDDLLDAIENRIAKFGKPDIVIGIGHSWGAKDAAEMVGHTLALKHGIGMDLLAGMDPTATVDGPIFVPKLTKRTVEFWASQGFPAGARKRDPLGGSGGMYTYMPGADKVVHRFTQAHIALGFDPRVHNIILKEIDDALAKRGIYAA
jgi:hypothetical protein